MSLPLPALTFYRMADQSPAAATISGLLNAIYTALTATVDYRGTSLPSTHLWTVGREQPAGTTEAVYCTAPAGTPMGLNPTLIIAGDSGAPTPTMASPDTFAASVVYAGLVKNSGAWNAWDNANPATSGTFSGYWRAAGTTWNSTTAKARVYISQEIIFVQLIGSTVTNQAWFFLGAIGEPHATNAASGGLDAETDDRLYGMCTTGTAGVLSGSWASTATGNSVFFTHTASDTACHMMVFQPGAAILYTCGRKLLKQAVSASAEATTPSGVFVGDLIPLCRTSATATHNGARLGTSRGMYLVGAMQSGKTIRNGSTDLYHVVGVDTSAVDDAIMLPAAA